MNIIIIFNENTGLNNIIENIKQQMSSSSNELAQRIIIKIVSTNLKETIQFNSFNRTFSHNALLLAQNIWSELKYHTNGPKVLFNFDIINMEQLHVIEDKWRDITCPLFLDIFYQKLLSNSDELNMILNKLKSKLNLRLDANIIYEKDNHQLTPPIILEAFEHIDEYYEDITQWRKTNLIHSDIAVLEKNMTFEDYLKTYEATLIYYYEDNSYTLLLFSKNRFMNTEKKLLSVNAVEHVRLVKQYLLKKSLRLPCFLCEFKLSCLDYELMFIMSNKTKDCELQAKLYEN